MKIRTIVLASAVLAISPVAFAEEAAPQGTADCASLQAQYDQAAAAASVEQLSQAKMARDEGEKLCAEGKSAEGSAKLKEALSQIAQPSQQPSG
ncbi:MAG: hypothetical protein ABI619_10785 [Betaproteobacteria bacterium]